MKATKLFSLFLALVFAAFAVFSANAADGELTGEEAALKLNALGLLAGVGSNADGSINFDTNGSLKRAHSITQVVRFLGAEKAATSETNEHPFTDLAEWAVPYISYAYANKITQGVSATKFDSDSAMSEAAFLTAILRVLGYVDKNDGSGDFVWSDPYALAKEAGLVDTTEKDADFKRGDAFIICYNALTAKVKSGDKICDRLVKSGAVEASKMQKIISSSKTGITVCGTDLAEYKIVVSAEANATEKLMAENIAKQIEGVCGTKPEITSDAVAAAPHEIVIGSTTRSSSAAENAGENDAIIIIGTTNIVIGGSSNTMLRRSANLFISEYISGEKSELTEADSFVGTPLSNPVRTNGQSGDPCIVYDEETKYYYALYSSPDNDRVLLFRAKTAAELGEAEGKEIYVAGADKEVKHKLYAPELKKMDGKWYIYASGATSMEDANVSPSKSIRLFCLEAKTDDPYGEYEFKAFLNDDIWAIDAHPFVYQGVNYIAFARIQSGNIISVARLENPWTIDASKVTVIATPTYSFETQSGKVNEGPFTFISPDGRLFMLYSANGVTSPYYSLGILEFTGTDILSKRSWTKHQTAVFEGTESIYAPGHCSVFMSPDGSEYWLAFHYQGTGGRKLGLNKFTFDESGFPVFGSPTSPSVYFMAPSGE